MASPAVIHALIACEGQTSLYGPRCEDSSDEPDIRRKNRRANQRRQPPLRNAPSAHPFLVLRRPPQSVKKERHENPPKNHGNEFSATESLTPSSTNHSTHRRLSQAHRDSKRASALDTDPSSSSLFSPIPYSNTPVVARFIPLHSAPPAHPATGRFTFVSSAQWSIG